jgi:hypothetical protein
LNGISAQIDTAGKVRLQGTVSSQEQHDRAVQITSSQTGVAGVVDLLQIAASQPAAENRDPARLEGEINRLLRNNGLGGVTAQVADDFSVTLKGSATSSGNKIRAFQLVRQFPVKGAPGTKCSLLSRFLMRKWSMNASFAYRLALAFRPASPWRMCRPQHPRPLGEGLSCPPRAGPNAGGPCSPTRQASRYGSSGT